MSKFKVGDRVRATREEGEWVRTGDLGTVTAVDGDSICALWNRPLQPHLDDEGWWVEADACDFAEEPTS